MAVSIVESYYKCEIHGEIKDDVLIVDTDSGLNKIFCLRCLVDKLSELIPTKVTKIK